MKKGITLATVFFSVFCSPFALADVGSGDPTLVNVPENPGGFFIGGTALYVQPTLTNGNLTYSQIFSPNTTATNFNTHLISNEPGYDWGWSVQAGYLFPQTGNDITASFLNFDSTHSTSIFPNNTQFLLTWNPASAPILGAQSKITFDLNQVDLDFGQAVNVGCRTTLHGYAGLRYIDLENKQNRIYTVDFGDSGSSGQFFIVGAGDPIGSVFLNEKSDFSGIGPLLGLDGQYYLGYGFGLVGHFDGAITVGNMDSDFDLIISVPANDGDPALTLTKDYTRGSKRRVVPVADGKLGMNYTFLFNQVSESGLTLEAGYQISHYFNGVDRLMIAVTQNSLPVFASPASQTSDFAFNGPYVNLTLRV